MVANLVRDKLLLALVLKYKLLLVRIVTVQKDILAVTRLVPNKVKKIVTALVSLNQNVVVDAQADILAKMVLVLKRLVQKLPAIQVIQP